MSAIWNAILDFVPGLHEEAHDMQLLGEGSFGKVCTDGKYAYKTVSKVSDLAELSFKREVEALSALQSCKHVIRLIEADQSALMITLEVMEGKDAFEVLSDRRLDKKKIIRQVLEVVIYIRDMGYVHNDLTTSNVRIFRDSSIKVYDFGCSGKIGEKRAWSDCGGNLSPEFICGAPLATSMDVWEMGVFIYELFSGQNFHPMETVTDQQRLYILNGRACNERVAQVLLKAIPFQLTLSRLGCSLDEETKKILFENSPQMAKDSMDDFISMLARASTLFYNIKRDLPGEQGRVVRAILQINPNKRPTPEQLLKDEFFAQ